MLLRRSECGAPATMPTGGGWEREDVGTGRAGPGVVPGRSEVSETVAS